jgi:hypothetical protein
MIVRGRQRAVLAGIAAIALFGESAVLMALAIRLVIEGDLRLVAADLVGAVVVGVVAYKLLGAGRGDDGGNRGGSRGANP